MYSPAKIRALLPSVSPILLSTSPGIASPLLPLVLFQLFRYWRTASRLLVVAAGLGKKLAARASAVALLLPV